MENSDSDSLNINVYPNRRRMRFDRSSSPASSSDSTKVHRPGSFSARSASMRYRDTASLSSTSSSERGIPSIPWTRFNAKHFGVHRNIIRRRDYGAGSRSKNSVKGPYIVRVRNFNETLEEDEISKMFEAFGGVQRTRLYRNLLGASTGTADISFTLKASAMSALSAINRRFYQTGTGLKARIIHLKNPTDDAKKQ